MKSRKQCAPYWLSPHKVPQILLQQLKPQAHRINVKITWTMYCFHDFIDRDHANLVSTKLEYFVTITYHHL